jgi:hypothetical protein
MNKKPAHKYIKAKGIAKQTKKPSPYNKEFAQFFKKSIFSTLRYALALRAGAVELPELLISRRVRTEKLITHDAIAMYCFRDAVNYFFPFSLWFEDAEIYFPADQTRPTVKINGYTYWG